MAVGVDYDLTLSDATYVFVPEEDGVYEFSFSMTPANEEAVWADISVEYLIESGYYFSVASAWLYSCDDGMEDAATSTSLLQAGQTYYITYECYDEDGELISSCDALQDAIVSVERVEVPDIAETGSYSVQLEAWNNVGSFYLAYTPSETGSYRVSLSDFEGVADVAIVDSTGSEVSAASYLNAGEEAVFLLVAGEIYYLKVNNLYTESAADTFTVSVENAGTPALALGEAYTANSTDAVYLTFTPVSDGTYTFSLTCAVTELLENEDDYRGRAFGYIAVYDSEMSYLAGTDGLQYNAVGESTDIATCELEAGKTYFVYFEDSFSYANGSVSVLVTESSAEVEEDEAGDYTVEYLDDDGSTTIMGGYVASTEVEENADGTYTVTFSMSMKGQAYITFYSIDGVEVENSDDGVYSFTIDSLDEVTVIEVYIVAWYGKGSEAVYVHVTKNETYSFEDVTDASKYYYAPIYAVADAGIMTGLGDGTTFGVGKSLNRQQMVVILYRIFATEEEQELYGSTESGYSSVVNLTDFEDVEDGKYYTAAVNWAYATGVTTGKTATHFGVGEECTFQQFCTFLARAICGGDSALEAAVTDAEAASALAAFSDASSVSSYARKAIAYLCGVEYEEGKYVVEGKADGTVAPGESVKRERAATVVYRCLAAGLLG